MALLLSVNGSFEIPTIRQPAGVYPPVVFGEPLGIQLLTFFPGINIKEWKGKAELMITSQVRVGPSNEPAPRRVNMILRRYNFKKANPIREYGGDIFGDRMLYFTKAFAGQRIGITLRGVEVDKVGEKTWNGITKTINTLGQLALFTSAAPYFAAAGLATKIVKTLLRAIHRNDCLTIQRKDFFFDEPNQIILQSGRYLFWKGRPTSKNMMEHFRLTGAGDPIPNVVVAKQNNVLYKRTPYFVLQIDAKERPKYESFEIGAGSAEILEKWGDKEAGATIFQTIQELGGQVNDARQLSEVMGLYKKLKKARDKDEKEKLSKIIKAHTELFSQDNGDLLKELLDPIL